MNSRETTVGSSIIATRPFARERWIVLLLCTFGAVRILLYSATFPFFSQVDEDLDFDLIIRYSHLDAPRQVSFLDPESVEWIIPYASPEFLQTRDQFPGGAFPIPIWKQPTREAAIAMQATRAVWRREPNFESAQPPLYYGIAAAWWKIGRFLNLGGLDNLYWLRFLNAAIVAGVVWIGYRAACVIDSEDQYLRLGVPLLLAGFPQNVFYSLNNDVLSPLSFGCLFLLVLRWLRGDLSLTLAILTGLAFAATYLTKLTNLPLLLVAAVALLAAGMNVVRDHSRRRFMYLVITFVVAAIPIAWWAFRTSHYFGDYTGSAVKIDILGWTRKPVQEWLQHPIFSVHGVWTFWSDLMANFWRGEMKWHNQPLRSPLLDNFYSFSTLISFPAVAFALWSGITPPSRRWSMLLAFMSFVGAVLFLAFLSIQFDYGACLNPSRAHPYFTSGRLLSGALIPFAVVYVFGIAQLLERFSPKLPLIVVTAIALTLTGSEFLLNRSAFHSEHNWFHR